MSGTTTLPEVDVTATRLPPDAPTPSVRQWIRKCSLVAGDAKDATELSALHVTFEIQSRVTTTPSTLSARIYNLSRETAQRLQDLKTVPAGDAVGVGSSAPGTGQVVLRAGYEGNFGIIFKGDIIQVRKGRDNAADGWVDIFAGDGDWGHVWGVINVTLAAGWRPDDVTDGIRKSLTAYGLSVGALPDTVEQAAAPRGKVCFGMTRDTIATMQKTLMTDGFVREGNLEWLPVAAYRPGDVVTINGTTGMIGYPEQTNFGITVRTLLNPSISPGSLIHVDDKSIQRAQYVAVIGEANANRYLEGNLSPAADGTYKVLAVNHFGDTRGDTWYTDIIAMARTPVGPTTPEAVKPLQFGGFEQSGIPIY